MHTIRCAIRIFSGGSTTTAQISDDFNVAPKEHTSQEQLIKFTEIMQCIELGDVARYVG